MSRHGNPGGRVKAGLSHTNKILSTVPVLTMAQRRSETSKGTLRSDPLEDRLSTAEKEVAIALDTVAYDELIVVASEALKHNPQTPSKTVIKSRKNLLWARSHAYHLQGSHSLALKDAKAALKMDPGDIAAYVRAAVLLGHVGHRAKALSSLDTAQSLASKYDPPTKRVWLLRIDRQRRKISGLSWRLFDRLPNEILIEVALHLDVASRISMSQTCRSWNHILTSAPCLWSSLTLDVNLGEPVNSKARSWIEYIQMRSQRADHRLESVTFTGTFPEPLIKKVCLILLASAGSLRHLEIPTRHEELCYRQLLRHCPQLKSLIFRPSSDVLVYNDLDWDQDPPVVQKPASAETFMLEYFETSSDRNNYLFIDKHLCKVRTLKGYNPRFDIGPNCSPIRQMVSSFVEHIREWQFAEQISRGQMLLPPSELTFPRLEKLSQLWLGAGGPLGMTFPRLLEVEIDLGLGGAGSLINLIHVLRTSPMLRSLSFMPCDLRTRPQDLRDALLGLRHLEILDLTALKTQDFISDLLLPQAVSMGAGQHEIFVPLSKLNKLAVDAQQTDMTKLAISLLVRERLRLGDNLAAAKRVASERLETLPKSKEPTAPPFQRGTTSSSNTSKSSKAVDSPCLKHTSDCTRLQHVLLSRVITVPEHIRDALASVTADLIFEYDEL